MQTSHCELIHQTRYLKAMPPNRKQCRSATAAQTKALGFHPRKVGLGGRGYNLNVTFNKENGAGGIVDVVAATVGQGLPPV
jgi:hypothetical protein